MKFALLQDLKPACSLGMASDGAAGPTFKGPLSKPFGAFQKPLAPSGDQLCREN